MRTEAEAEEALSRIQDYMLQTGLNSDSWTGGVEWALKWVLENS